MMELLWSDILRRFGGDAVLRRGESEIPVRAILQPILEQGEAQETASPLGLERQERFRYFGPARHPLDMDTIVEHNGREYRVLRAQLAGEGVCPHWRAVLYPREEAL